MVHCDIFMIIYKRASRSQLRYNRDPLRLIVHADLVDVGSVSGHIESQPQLLGRCPWYLVYSHRIWSFAMNEYLPATVRIITLPEKLPNPSSGVITKATDGLCDDQRVVGSNSGEGEFEPAVFLAVGCVPCVPEDTIVGQIRAV